MIWIAPSEKDTATDTLEKRLWDAADQFRANSGLKPQEYLPPSSTGCACPCQRTLTV
jgi:type I restriction enzyme M protein